jgi:hypothetical protein
MNATTTPAACPLRPASLAPIYAAFLFLVSMGMLALAVAFWPEDSVPSASHPQRDEAAPAADPPDSDASRSRIPRPAPGRGIWA